MMRAAAVLLGVLFAGASCLADGAGQPDAPDRFACDALKAINLTEPTGAPVRVAEVGILPAAGDQPRLCRVNGFIDPQVGFEIRMPVTHWNGKLLVT
ncbi:MAG: hypothetical protein ABIX37_03735, partial [Gammaproteobacteria bacterium]